MPIISLWSHCCEAGRGSVLSDRTLSRGRHITDCRDEDTIGPRYFAKLDWLYASNSRCRDDLALILLLYRCMIPYLPVGKYLGSQAIAISGSLKLPAAKTPDLAQKVSKSRMGRTFRRDGLKCSINAN